MRTCTCPECGEDLIITCPSGHARAAAGVCELDTPPAVRAAREPAPLEPARYRARGGSVSAVVLTLMEPRRQWQKPDLLSAVRQTIPDASDGNLSVTLTKLVRAGMVTRLARGVYVRRAA